MKLKIILISIFILLCTFSYDLAAQNKNKDKKIDFSSVREYINKNGISESEKFKKIFTLGEKLFSKGNYLDAAIAFGEATKESPTHPLACLMFGHSFFAVGHFANSAKLIKRAMTLFPNWGKIKLDLRKLYPNPKDFAKQFQKLSLTIQLKKMDFSAQFLLGYIYFFTNRRKKAKLVFEFLKQYIPNDSGVKYFLTYFDSVKKKKYSKGDTKKGSPLSPGWSLFTKGKYERAIDFFSTLYLNDPSQATALFELAHCFFAIRRYSHATSMIKLGLKKVKGWEGQVLNLKDFYINPEIYENQLKKLTDHLKKSPKDRDALFLLGYNYYFTKEYEKARKVFKRLLDIDENYSEAKIFLKGIEKRKKDGEKKASKEVEKKGTKKVNITAERLMEIGINYFKNGRYLNAARSFLNAIKINDKNISAWVKLSMTAFATEDYSYALDALRQGLKFQKDFSKLKCDWKDYFSSQKDFNIQLNNLVNWINSNKDDKKAAILLGYVYFFTKRFRDAKTQLSSLKLNKRSNKLEFKLLETIKKKR